MTTVYCDRITCDNNCDYECVLDFIHVDENGKCCELIGNPYHCKYKNVSRETFYTIPEIWHYINFCNAMVLCPLCCTECSLTTRTRCIMYDIAMNLIFETGVC